METKQLTWRERLNVSFSARVATSPWGGGRCFYRLDEQPEATEAAWGWMMAEDREALDAAGWTKKILAAEILRLWRGASLPTGKPLTVKMIVTNEWPSLYVLDDREVEGYPTINDRPDFFLTYTWQGIAYHVAGMHKGGVNVYGCLPVDYQGALLQRGIKPALFAAALRKMYLDRRRKTRSGWSPICFRFDYDLLDELAEAIKATRKRARQTKTKAS